MLFIFVYFIKLGQTFFNVGLHEGVKLLFVIQPTGLRHIHLFLCGRGNNYFSVNNLVNKISIILNRCLDENLLITLSVASSIGSANDLFHIRGFIVCSLHRCTPTANK